MALFWSNVGVDVQTGLAAAITISNITKATTAVCTYTGATAPTNGDYVNLSINGMFELNGRTLRVANVLTGPKTFELEGEDSTTYSTFTSGTIQVITYGASMTTAQTINVSGGDPEFADLTTIHDNVRKKAPTINSELTLSMDNIFDLADPAFVELNKAYKAKTTRSIRLRFGTGPKMVLTAYASAAGVPTGQAQGVVQTKITLTAQGVPTLYAS